MPTIFCILVLKYEMVMVADSKKMDHRYGMDKKTCDAFSFLCMCIHIGITMVLSRELSYFLIGSS